MDRPKEKEKEIDRQKNTQTYRTTCRGR